MSIGPVTPSRLVRPDYQSGEGYRRDVWRGRLRVAGILLAGVLLVAAAVAARAGVRAWLEQRERVRVAWGWHLALLADEARCVSYAAPPTQPVYSEPMGEVGAMLRQPDCAPITWGGARGVMCLPAPNLPTPAADEEVTAAARFPSLLYRFPVTSRSGAAFIGGRRSPGGNDRLVVVLVWPTNKPASPRPRTLDFTAVAFSAAGPEPGDEPVAGATKLLSIPVPARTYARVLAGQRDPSDPARFTIRYELGERCGTVAGCLNDDGSVSSAAEPRDPSFVTPRTATALNSHGPVGTIRSMRHPTALVTALAALTVLGATATAEAQNVRRDIPYAGADDPKRTLDVYAPAGAKGLPVVFWIHGGGWQSGDKSDVKLKPQWFMDKGFVFVSTNYRLLPAVDMGTLTRDVAKAFRWVHDHAADYGGDPGRVLVGGHSAGAQLAALLCTDERYLKEQGISFGVLKGCVPVDGDTYDIPAIIEVAETRWRVHGMPPNKFGHREKFGNDAAKHRDFSAVTHVAKDKGIPPFLVLHVAGHPDTSAQAFRLGAVLKAAGVPVRVFGAKDSEHTKLNDDLGLPDDPATKALDEFVAQAVKRK